MRHLRLAGILLALLLVPSVSAGSERAPEMTSPQDKPNPAGDLLAVWFENDEDGLLVTFKTASLSARHTSLMYYVNFDLHERIVSPAIGFDAQGRLRTDSGGNFEGWATGRLDDEPIVREIARGSPAYLTMLIPWGMYDLTPGDHVHPQSAMSSMCCDRSSGGGWYTPYDEAESRTDQFDIIAPGVMSSFGGIFPILVPSWVIPAIVVTCTASGLGLGTLIAMKGARKPEPNTAAPAPVPARTVPPPGQRFQRAPPTRRP